MTGIFIRVGGTECTMLWTFIEVGGTVCIVVGTFVEKDGTQFINVQSIHRQRSNVHHLLLLDRVKLRW